MLEEVVDLLIHRVETQQELEVQEEVELETLLEQVHQELQILEAVAEVLTLVMVALAAQE
jgi:hypothetical protein